MIEYDRWHESLGDDDDTSSPWHNFVKRELRAEDLATKDILEIGCGRGGFSNYIAKHQHQPRSVTGSDYSSAALDIALARYGDAGIITWRQQDIMALDFETASFDTVISCETIEHVPNPKKAISELFRVLKPGGKLFLTCPNYFNLFGIWCFYRVLIRKPFTEGGQPYVNYILSPVVRSWIRAAGFEIGNFYSSEIIIPARVPKHFWNEKTPNVFRLFGYRTYYILYKR